MKKTITMILIISMALSLLGCGANGGSTELHVHEVTQDSELIINEESSDRETAELIEEAEPVVEAAEEEKEESSEEWDSVVVASAGSVTIAADAWRAPLLQDEEEAAEESESESQQAAQQTQNQGSHQNTTAQNNTQQNNTAQNSNQNQTSQNTANQNSNQTNTTQNTTNNQSSSQNTNQNNTAQQQVHTHSYVYSKTVAPSCIADGYDLMVCSCGDSKKENTTPALGHDMVLYSDSATCTDDGYKTFSCSRCGYVTVESSPSIGGGVHASTTTYVYQATCYQVGARETVCDVCGATVKYEQTSPMVDHDWMAIGGDLADVQFCGWCGAIELTPGISQSDAAWRTLSATNSYRSAAGVGALSYSQYLCDLAYARAQELVYSFSHAGFRGCNGENIAYGYYGSYDVVAAWSYSQGHYENMVRDWFTEYGFAYFVANGTVYCVQLFN